MHTHLVDPVTNIDLCFVSGPFSTTRLDFEAFIQICSEVHICCLAPCTFPATLGHHTADTRCSAVLVSDMLRSSKDTAIIFKLILCNPYQLQAGSKIDGWPDSALDPDLYVGSNLDSVALPETCKVHRG